MKLRTKVSSPGMTLVAAAVAAVLVACSSTAVKPTGAAEARARLTQLQSDPNLANRAPIAIQSADTAVRAAEQPEADSDLAMYRVYIADRKVDTARALAETRLAEDQRSTLRAQSEKARLDARTRELDVAQGQTAAAKIEGDEQTLVADRARGEAAAADVAATNSAQQASDARSEAQDANLAAANSNQQAAELQRQIDLLQGRITDRGVIVTVGDTLFSADGIDLRGSSSGNLDKVVAFLDQYPERTATIEGFSDNAGTDDENQAMSQGRADSVKSYLVGQGVSQDRLTASGRGDTSPVAANDSASGRQQNRRVEVIINPPAPILQ